MPALPPDIEARLKVYTAQMWGMSVVYIEAILEFYFGELVNQLSLGNSRVPRQAAKLISYVQRQISAQHGHTLILSPEHTLQSVELTETRHLWVHSGGIVDNRYLFETAGWWSSRPDDWWESVPVIGQERVLTETYIKSNLVLSKTIISKVDEQLANWGF